jgi:hypothetical protein
MKNGFHSEAEHFSKPNERRVTFHFHASSIFFAGYFEHADAFTLPCQLSRKPTDLS